MFYPTGQKQKYQKNGVIYGNRGMSLESLINYSNEFYLDTDRAIIYKKPTPIGLVDVDYKRNRINKAYFKDKSSFDYSGVYRGKHIDFEAKESHNNTSFPLANIHPHQLVYLERILRHGAISFLIVYIAGEYYLLDGNLLLDFIKNNERKSIPLSFFKENCPRIEEKLRPNLDYLKVVDEVYFKGDNKNA